MSHHLNSDDKYRDLIYDDDDRSYLVARSTSPGAYRFGRTPGKPVRGQAARALRRVNGYLKNMIEAIANAKLRRMERELWLRGVSFNRSNDSRVVRYSEPTEGQE